MKRNINGLLSNFQLINEGLGIALSKFGKSETRHPTC